MELKYFFAGENLLRLVNICDYMGEKSFPERDFVEILLQQNKVLEHLRKHSILHCDIKPDNIMYNP